MSQQAVTHDINQIGNLMADQPKKTKDSPATVQDLHNMGIGESALPRLRSIFRSA